MYELTNETVAGRKYYALLELDDGTVLTNYGDEAVGITSISLSSTLCGSESVSIGCVNAASVTIVMAAEAGTALENQRFGLCLGQEFDGEVEWVPMGIFTAVKAEVSEDKLTVEAWDDLYFAGGTYTPSDSVTGECTVATALEDVCSQAGLTFSGTVPSLTIAGMPTGLTCSAAIGYLAALCGANACMDRDGCLVFRQFAETGQGLGGDDCYSGGMVFKTSDFTVASLTNTLEVETTGDDGETATESVEVERTTGAAGGCIALTNPLMTEDNIDTAWDVVKGFTYRPATLTAVGQLAVDVGDVLRVCALTGGRNYLLNTRALTAETGKVSWNTSYWMLEEDADGYGVLTGAGTGSAIVARIYTGVDASGDAWAGKDLVFSCDVKADSLTTLPNYYRFGCAVMGSKNGASWTALGASSYEFSSASVEFNSGDFADGDWFRLTCRFQFGTLEDMGIDASAYSYLVYSISLGFPSRNSGYSMSVRKPKLELGTAATDWTPALEDDDESVYSVPVMTHTLEYDGGLKSTITAAGESESQQSAAVSGPMAQQIKELTTKVTDTKVLVNGKNAVYYAAAAPSAEDYALSVNDLWFDTSGGDYAPHYWDGSQWVEAPFGSDALGEGSVIASKILAGAVTAEKLNVAELSAITADLGTVTAGNISGVTISGSTLISGSGESGDSYTKITGGSLTAVGEGGIKVSVGDPDEEQDETDTGYYWYLFLGGEMQNYDDGYSFFDSPEGAVCSDPTGIRGYYLSVTPWFHVVNKSQSLYINGFRVPEIQHGYVTITPEEAIKPTGVEITFDQAFSGTPHCVACPATTVPGTVVTGVSVADVSTTGMTVYLTRTTTVATNVHWIAIY